ncbi:hypothetical protein ABPG77_001434 [Micractinium sp. CCAP 211/92]
MGNSMSLAVSVGVPVLGGMVIGTTVAPEIPNWYSKLKKPSWTPPSWLFGPVWTVLYAAMGVASHRVWAAGGGPLPLGLYAAQLVLNLAWTPLFFKAHNLKAATVDITALVGVLGATIYEFSKVDTLAAQLLIPYLGWVSFATALTINIMQNNPKYDSPSAGGKPAAAAAKLADNAEVAARRAGDAATGAASEATAAAANVFLSEGGEKQQDEVRPEVAEATAARTAGRSGTSGGAKKAD